MPPAEARAAGEDEVAGHALIIGANRGGRGQDPLRYAESDANRVAELLVDLGDYSQSNVTLLLQPNRTQLAVALAKLSAQVLSDRAAGRSARVFFYYSGHARATALNLADEEVPLVDLRRALTGLGGLTVVVLDACQSGAFSRVKGARPAADFSHNSLANLGARGVAVMASSSASELSQESDRLGSSYFTHHLLAGLRGAADTSGDGRVSLDEAHRYAYHQTLVATTATRVGAQHVSLEVDLVGHGEVALSFPRRAEAHLTLPPGLQGEVLVEHVASGTVMAEIHKAKGERVEIGVPAARYRALIRMPGADHLLRCDMVVGRGRSSMLDTRGCARVALRDAVVKGETSAWSGPRWSLELGAGLTFVIEDEFNRRLQDFGYVQSLEPRDIGHVSLAVGYAVYRELSVVGEVAELGRGSYSRHIDGDFHYRWRTTAAGLHLRGRRSYYHDRIRPFAQVGGGIATAYTALDNEHGPDQGERYWGWHLGASLGVEIMMGRHLGIVSHAGFVTAPVIENLAGDTHDSGGGFWRFALRGTL